MADLANSTPTPTALIAASLASVRDALAQTLTVLHGVARPNIGTGVSTNTPLSRCAADVSYRHKPTTALTEFGDLTIGKSDSDPRWSFPLSAPLPSLKSAMSRRRDLFGAHTAEVDHG